MHEALVCVVLAADVALAPQFAELRRILLELPDEPLPPWFVVVPAVGRAQARRDPALRVRQISVRAATSGR